MFEKKKKIMNWGKELLFLNILLQIKVQIGSPGLQDDTFVRVFLTESFWLSLSNWLLLSRKTPTEVDAASVLGKTKVL